MESGPDGECPFNDMVNEKHGYCMEAGQIKLARYGCCMSDIMQMCIMYYILFDSLWVDYGKRCISRMME
jgi:hypothetical protein